MMSLAPMLEPRSIAIVGASERPGSVGDQTTRQLLSGGFTGEVFPVNPRYDTVHGLTAHRSILEVTRPVDLAVLAVANDQLEAEMEKAVQVGVRSVAIFASCNGLSSSGEPLRDRIGTIASEAGIPICGGNGMGFLNVEERVRVCGFYQPPGLMAGGVTFLSHSGSLFSAMLHNRREIRFNLVVSTGLEINTAMDAYMLWALDLASTRVIGVFLETIRDPVGFRHALAVADERDIPVVALKVGATSRGREAVATHSEAVAGDDAVYEALFDAHGVHRVWSMDEMADTIALFEPGRRATAAGLGAVHDSGGEKALLIDTASRLGVALPAIGEGTERRIAAVLDPGLEPSNPVDAWGTGRGAEEVFVETLLALADDPAIGVVVFCVDLTPEEEPDDAYSNAAFEAVAATAKPVAVLGNLATTIDPIQAGRLRGGGVPVLEGTETGLLAVRHLIDRHLRSLRPPLESRSAPARSVADRDLSGEAAAMALLADYGIPTPHHEVADDAGAVAAVARRIGYPLVLKTNEGFDHKTDVGGVVVGIEDEEGLLAAYRDLSTRLGPRVIISEQIPSGVEVGLGMVTDPQFGTVVIVSAGGALIELLSDRVAILPPVDLPRASDALGRLAMSPVLEGVRGEEAVNIAALAEVVVRFSELAMDLAGVVDAIDVNPVIVGPERAVAVDALLARR